MIRVKPQQEITNLSIKPGNKVSVSASWETLKSGDASFVVCNDSEHKCVDGTEAASKPDNHAEWITERTAYCKSGHYWFPALASYATVEFSASYYDLTGTQDPEYPISHGAATKAYMLDSTGETLSTPGSLGSGGTAFNTVWNDYGKPSEIQPPQEC